jgi:hypothetical protein
MSPWVGPIPPVVTVARGGGGAKNSHAPGRGGATAAENFISFTTNSYLKLLNKINDLAMGHG